MKKLFTLLAASFFVLTSCSKDEANQSQVANTTLPKTITTTEDGAVVDVANYIYSGNQLVSIEGHDVNKYYKYEYTYDNTSIVAEKWFVKSNPSDAYVLSNTKNFTYYNDGKLHYFEESRPGLPTITKFNLTYNNDGTITCVESDINESGVEFLHAKTSINTMNSNFIAANSSMYDFSTSSFVDVSVTRNFIYDNHNKMTKNIVGYNELLGHTYVNSLNKNVLQSTTSSTDGGLVTSVTTAFEYTYNANNYPIVKNTYDASGTLIRVANITYYE